MNSEPFFLVDEELDKFQEELKGLMLELKNPKLTKKARALSDFTKACIYTFKKPDYKLSFLEPVKEPHRIEKIVKKIPVGYDVWPVPKPNSKEIEKFKARAKYREIKMEKVIPASHRELITDKFTGKVLASAQANKRYVVKEPRLRGNDVKIIRKILNMHPRNMKIAWDLIKKEGLSDIDATGIKYYVANELFAFGKIEPLLHDSDIKVVSCDGVGKYMKIKFRDKVMRTNFIFKDKRILDNYVYNIARKLGKTISEDNPVIDSVYRGFRIYLILGIRTSSKFIFKRVE